MTIKQNLRSVIGNLSAMLTTFPVYENQQVGFRPALTNTKKDQAAKSDSGIKKIQTKLCDFVYLQKTGSGIFLKQDQVIKAFSILTTTLLIAYLAVYNTLYFVQPDVWSKIVIASPLLLSIGLLVAAYRKLHLQALLIITWLLPASMVLVSFYDPAINYSKVILVYTLVLLFQDSTRKQRSISFIYLTVAYLTIQFRYYYAQKVSSSDQFITFEMVMLPVFSVIIFLILSRIKKEFTIYQIEIRHQKEMLEKKNRSLESLVSFSEQQREKLKRTVMLKEKLISVISHDVRVPLNAFKMLINNYEKGYMTDELMINGIVETKKDISKIDNMILDLVSWSRNDAPAAGQQQITSQNFKETIDSVLSLYNLCTKTKDLEIIKAIETPANMCMLIPKREFEIIVRNLVSNAIKYSNPGSKIFISLKAEKDLSSTMTLSVKDLGMGIHPATLKRLSSNKVTSSMGTLDEVGLGVGLSIVFDVINDHNLRYDIQSEVNMGTEFSINIPLVSCERNKLTA